MSVVATTARTELHLLDLEWCMYIVLTNERKENSPTEHLFSVLVGIHPNVTSLPQVNVY